MPFAFDWHDAIHLASLLLVSVGGIIKLSRDNGLISQQLKAIQKWCDDHQAADTREFDRIDRDVREIRQGRAYEQ